jgi:hypothetical protein
MHKRNNLITSICLFVIIFLVPGISFAASNLPILGQVSTGASVSYVVEAGIVLLLFGGAIYAVSKTSYRR